MDSKYEVAGFVSDRVNIRQYTPKDESDRRYWFGVEPSATYDLTAFADTYAMVNWGGTKRSGRIFKGETISLTPLIRLQRSRFTYMVQVL